MLRPNHFGVPGSASPQRSGPQPPNASKTVPTGQIQPQKPRLNSTDSSSAPMTMTTPAGTTASKTPVFSHAKKLV